MLISCLPGRTPGPPGLLVKRRSNPFQQNLTALRRRRGLTLIELSVVIVVMSILITVLGSLYSRFSVFKSTQDEATMLRDSLSFARSAAIRSNDTIYFEFNLEDESYRAFRKYREEDKWVEKDLIKPRNLASGNALVAIQIGAANRQSKGKAIVRMYPDGSSDELMIFLGPDPDINNTVMFSRYGKAEVAKGEKEAAREDPTFREVMEEMQ